MHLTLSRRVDRRLVAGLVALALGGAAFAGCGSDGPTATDDSGPSATTADTSIDAAGSATLVAFLTTEFEDDDSDGDGTLDQAEITTSIEGDFEDSDVTGDGVVTIDDVQKELDDTGGGTADQPLDWYMPYDADGDGTITVEEYTTTVMADVMAPMDTDSSGTISLDEAIAWHQARIAEGADQ